MFAMKLELRRKNCRVGAQVRAIALDMEAAAATDEVVVYRASFVDFLLFVCAVLALACLARKAIRKAANRTTQDRLQKKGN